MRPGLTGKRPVKYDRNNNPNNITAELELDDEQQKHEFAVWIRHRVPQFANWSDERIWRWNERRLVDLEERDQKIDEYYHVPPEGVEGEYRQRRRGEFTGSAEDRLGTPAEEYKRSLERIQKQTDPDLDKR